MNQSSPRSWLTALGAGGASGRAVAAGSVMDGPVPDVGSQAPLRGHPHPAPSSAPGPGTPGTRILGVFTRLFIGRGGRKCDSVMASPAGKLCALWERKAAAPLPPPPGLLSEHNDPLETHRERLMAG